MSSSIIPSNNLLTIPAYFHNLNPSLHLIPLPIYLPQSSSLPQLLKSQKISALFCLHTPPRLYIAPRLPLLFPQCLPPVNPRLYSLHLFPDYFIYLYIYFPSISSQTTSLRIYLYIYFPFFSSQSTSLRIYLYIYFPLFSLIALYLLPFIYLSSSHT